MPLEIAGGVGGSITLAISGIFIRRLVVYELVGVTALIGSGVGTAIGVAMLGASIYSLFKCDFIKLKNTILKQEQENYKNII